MKNILKIILITSFTILSYSSFSQKNYNELREIQEIKQIIKDDTSKKLSLFFFKSYDDTIRLPLYFITNKRFNSIFKNQIQWKGFIQSKEFNLSKNDCDFLNRAIINDTNRLYIQKSWFEDKKVIFTTDSSLPWYMKPIFLKTILDALSHNMEGVGFLIF